MYRENDLKLIEDENTGGLVGRLVTAFSTALGSSTQSDIVIVRLYDEEWEQQGPGIPAEQVFQFVIPAKRAADLGMQLIEMAAQAEKQRGTVEH